MKHFILLAILLTLSNTATSQNIDSDPLVGRNGTNYVGTDRFGNKVYSSLDWYQFLDTATIYTTNFIFIHAAQTDGKIASISIPTILDTDEAGFSIVSANTLMEMSENNQKGMNQVYTVNCPAKILTDEQGRSYSLADMQGVYHTAVTLSCEILQQETVAKRNGTLLDPLSKGWSFRKVLH